MSDRDDAHTCSHHCDRPECIRAQRDELRAEVERLADDAMWLDAEREYWQREATTARAERAALRRRIAELTDRTLMDNE